MSSIDYREGIQYFASRLRNTAPRAVFRKRPAKYYTPDTIFRGCRIARYTGLGHVVRNGPVTYHRIELTDRYRIKQILSGGEKASTAENLEIFPLASEHVPNMYRMCNG